MALKFEQSLHDGVYRERVLLDWFNRHGYSALHIVGDGSGPRLMTPSKAVVCPDLLVFKGNAIRWIESKSKSAFTWYRKTQTFQTGIDRFYWSEYQQIRSVSGCDVWLVFLQMPGQVAKDTPAGMASPSGLYAGEILELASKVDHEFDGEGKGGMMYWNESAFKKLANAEDLNWELSR